LQGTLKSGAHYFVVSNNTYNIFDIEIPRDEIGYVPEHDAEAWMGIFGSRDGSQGTR